MFTVWIKFYLCSSVLVGKMLPRHFSIWFLLVIVIGSCESKAPNIVLFLTDDLDSELGGLTPLTKTKEWIGDQGTSFDNAFVVVPICCPSRFFSENGMHIHYFKTFLQWSSFAAN